MASRFWVGGTDSWNATAGTKWATTSGGAGGASVPTSSDDVYFDANSGTNTVTVAATSNCLSLNFTGFTGTFAGTSSVFINGGNLTIASGMTWTHSGNLAFSAATGTYTITSNGKAITSAVNFGSSGIATATWTLGDAFNTSNTLTLTSGTFTTNNYNVTASSLSSSNSNTRTINLGSSTVTLSGASGAVNFSTQTNLTFNAGTSTVSLSSAGATLVIGTGVTFYNVSWTNTAITTVAIQGSNIFNNVTVVGKTAAGISTLRIDADQTINGTLTLSAGANATARTFVQSNTIGTTRTITCAAVASLTDIDFRDITIAGAAVSGGNLTGTRLGDCKGNSGITFDAGVSKYWVLPSSGNFGIVTWSTTPTLTFTASCSGTTLTTTGSPALTVGMTVYTSTPASLGTITGGSGNTWTVSIGGTAASQKMYAGNIGTLPLAQDTAVFQADTLNSGNTVTVNAAYNIGTIDMSARTSNTMTLATGTTTPNIYGNWINGTGTTLTGIGTLAFVGRGSQTITSAGKTFTQSVGINSPSGSVTLQDALNTSLGSSSAFNHVSGTFDASGYNVTISGASGGVVSQGATTRTLALGSGTWTLSGTGGWNVSGSNLTITGTGTINLTSASAKTFAGGGFAYTNITLNQGGAGALTITGSNTFKDITNTYSATGATTIKFTSGTTTILSQFSATGASGKVLTLGATTTSRATLQKGSSWLMGANSTDGGNNLGLSFTAGGGIDYLSVSYINGTVVAPPATSTGNFFFFF